MDTTRLKEAQEHIGRAYGLIRQTHTLATHPRGPAGEHAKTQLDAAVFAMIEQTMSILVEAMTLLREEYEERKQHDLFSPDSIEDASA